MYNPGRFEEPPRSFAYRLMVVVVEAGAFALALGAVIGWIHLALAFLS